MVYLILLPSSWPVVIPGRHWNGWNGCKNHSSSTCRCVPGEETHNVRMMNKSTSMKSDTNNTCTKTKSKKNLSLIPKTVVCKLLRVNISLVCQVHSALVWSLSKSQWQAECSYSSLHCATQTKQPWLLFNISSSFPFGQPFTCASSKA